MADPFPKKTVAQLAKAASNARSSTSTVAEGVSGAIATRIPPEMTQISPSLARLAQSKLLGKGNGGVEFADVLTDVGAQILGKELGITKQGAASVSTVRAPFAVDDRVRLSLSPNAGPIMYNSYGIMEPLRQTNGLIFPYTPTINVAHSAEYDTQGLPHTNYAHHSYARSGVDAIQIVGDFTAETQNEAAYLLAAIQFLKSCTKMFYGTGDNRGTPPPVLRLSGHGVNMYHSLPVVITTTTFDFPNNVDYITLQQPGGGTTNVPTSMQLNASLLVVQSRTRTLDFSLRAYAQGNLIGEKNGKGGFA